MSDETGFCGERDDALQPRLGKELHAHVPLLAGAHREREMRVDGGVDRLQQTVATPWHLLAPRAHELDRRTTLSINDQYSARVAIDPEAAFGADQWRRRYVVVVGEVPRITQDVGGVVATGRERCRGRRIGRTRIDSWVRGCNVGNHDGRQQTNDDSDASRAALHSDLLKPARSSIGTLQEVLKPILAGRPARSGGLDLVQQA